MRWLVISSLGSLLWTLGATAQDPVAAPPSNINAAGRDAAESKPAAATPPSAEAAPPPTLPPPPTASAPPTAPPAYQAPTTTRPLTTASGVVALQSGVLVPYRIATRLLVLESDLNALAARGNTRIIDGIGAMLFGGISIAIGALANERALSSYLYVLGGVGITRGILDLALTPNAEQPALEYTHMTMHSVDEVKQRLLFGEASLERLAKRTKLVRLLDGSLSVAVGLASLPVYFGPQGFSINDGAAIFVIAASSISVVTGLIGLLVRSESEKRWGMYKKLRTRLQLERQRQLQGPQTSASVAPLSGGAMATLRVAF